MLDRNYVQLMAQYNSFMNESLYSQCAALSDEERQRDRGAFFKSIHGTLSHILWADRAFLIRVQRRDEPLGQPTDVPFPVFDDLRAERRVLDQTLLDWANALDEGALDEPFEIYSVVYKMRRRMPTYMLVVQMFNHQTHHRGQLTTLLSQLGIDPGVTDIPFMPYAKSLVTDLD